MSNVELVRRPIELSEDSDVELPYLDFFEKHLGFDFQKAQKLRARLSYDMYLRPLELCLSEFEIEPFTLESVGSFKNERRRDLIMATFAGRHQALCERTIDFLKFSMFGCAFLASISVLMFLISPMWLPVAYETLARLALVGTVLGIASGLFHDRAHDMYAAAINKDWQTTPMADYQEYYEIPPEIVVQAQRINERVPNADFFVHHFGDDHLLSVRYSWEYYLCRW